MSLVQQIIERAKSNKQRIVLPEATEERTLRAADRVLAEDIADLILIGNPDEIHRLAKEWGLENIDKATLIDPENNPKSEEYAELLTELRKKKGMTIEKARELVKNPLYLGCNLRSLEHYWRHPAPSIANHQVLAGHHLRERCHAAHHQAASIWREWHPRGG